MSDAGNKATQGNQYTLHIITQTEEERAKKKEEKNADPN